MKVVVEILTGTLFYIEVEDNVTVADLKREIGAQQELPCDRMILLLHLDDNQNHPLSSDGEDGVSLVDCGVKDGSKLYLFFNPVDDGPSQRSAFTLPDSFVG